MRFYHLEHWLDWFEQEHPKEIDRGLARVSQVAKSLGLLSSAATVVTIAGTNGKGSSVAFLESILNAGDITTGSYTSPHIHRYNERIRINGAPVSDEQIMAAFAVIDTQREGISLSYFEFSTLAALYIFREEEVEVSILEVGLGGRLDAVNIIDADIAMITNISLDHMQWLGNSIEEIAPEKAAVARENSPAIIADPAYPPVLEQELTDIGAELFIAGKAYQFSETNEGWVWQQGSKPALDLPLPVLSGKHQLENAAGVIMATQCLPSDMQPDIVAISTGLQQVVIAGRQELFDVCGCRLLMDVAHNAASAIELNQRIKNEAVTGRIIILIGMMEDKDVAAFIRELDVQVDEWMVSNATTERAMAVDELAIKVRKAVKNQTVTGFSSILNAWESACGLATSDDLIVVTGSFHIVAEIRQKLIESRLVTE